MTREEIRAQLRELTRVATPLEALAMLWPNGLPPIAPTGLHCLVATRTGIEAIPGTLMKGR